jgi:site-specific DNA recombinase
MKKAIIISRVSSDEQKKKGYSLGMQEESLAKHCHKESIEIVKMYREDHSAKNFDRPEWKKLMVYVKANRKNIDYIMFTTWDRFSRNISEALLVIDKLRSFGVEPIAIEQQLDLSIPETKAMLALYLVMPEIDNDRRSIKVKEGMRGSLKAGRWSCKAPYGYSNKRDEHGKAIIVPDDNAKWIRHIFNEVVKDTPQAHIRKIGLKNGLAISKNAMSHLLRNHVYRGKIVVPAFKDEPLQLIDGIHQPIIQDELFFKVQNKLIASNKKRNLPKSYKYKNELPLRGNITCSKCDNKLTGSGSRSKTGSRYFYYHCNSCHQERYRADAANELLEGIVKGFSFKNEANQLYQIMVDDLLNGDANERSKKLKKTDENIKSTKNRISNLQDMLVDNKIAPNDFTQMKNKYDNSLFELEEQHAELINANSDMSEWLSKGINIITNMGDFYTNASIEGKQQLISSIFPENVQFVDKKCRTPRINEALRLILLMDKGSTKNKKGQLPKNLELSHKVPGMGVEPTRPKDTSPSSLHVYQFRHPGKHIVKVYKIME